MEKEKNILYKEMENLKINVCEALNLEKSLIISLRGSIDTFNSQQFQKLLNKLIKGGYIRIIFSCSNLNYISSMGIGIFSAIHKTVKKNGGDIVFSGMQEKLLHLFHHLGFMTFFKFEDNLEKALSSFTSC